MDILILDDNADRHRFFREYYQWDKVVHCYTYDDFVAHLSDNIWDLIHLDHDLGDFQDNASTYVDGWGKEQNYNGYHATRRILELPADQYPKQVIIQSVNPEGAMYMLQDLRRAGIPTTWEPYGDVAWGVPDHE